MKKKSTNRKPKSANGNRGMSKTAFILSQSSDASAAEIIAKGKAAGLKLNERYVYTIRSKARTSGKAVGSGRVGRPRKSASAPTSSVSGYVSNLDQQLVELALEIGLTRAEELIKSTREKLTAL